MKSGIHAYRYNKSSLQIFHSLRAQTMTSLKNTFAFSFFFSLSIIFVNVYYSVTLIPAESHLPLYSLIPQCI